MEEFNAGDKVVRKGAFQDSTWVLACARSDRATDGVFIIDLVSDDSISVEGLPGYWDASCFSPATGLEEHQSVGLPAEDRLHEANVHIECLREKIAGLEAELRKCCGTVADKPNLEKVVKQLSADVADLQAQLGLAKTLADESNDQRDAAVLAAKSLGEEVHNLRQDRRDLRVDVAELTGQLDALEAGVADIDLEQLSNQLALIGNMAYEQGNEADGKMCLDAAQVVCLLNHILYVSDDE